MSQGEFDKNNPWAWSDKTIVGLMREVQTIRDLVANTPNNYELGAKVREWAAGNDPEETDATP